MNIKKIIKYILIAVPVLFLAKCGVETVIYDTNKIPEINPYPKDKVRIYGKFPFENDVNMKITILYINKNRECDDRVWLAGTQFPRQAKKIFSTDIKNQSFESMVDLDYFVPGVCQWKAHRIYAYMESKKGNIFVFGEGVIRAKKDVNVLWESSWNELYEDGKIIFKPDLELYAQMGRSKVKYEQLYPKKLKLPSDIKLGTIDYKNLSSANRSFNFECIKKMSDVNSTKAFIICNGYDKDKVANVIGYDWKFNISSLKKEIQFNFIDKGWKK